MFMLFRCVTDVNLPPVGPYELSKAPSVVAMIPEMMGRSGRTAVRVAVSVAVVCGTGRRDLVNWGDCGVTFLEIGFTVPWLPVGGWTTKENLPGHPVRHNIEVRPQAASAASGSYVPWVQRGQMRPSSKPRR
jgi:hypothetical protein